MACPIASNQDAVGPIPDLASLGKQGATQGGGGRNVVTTKEAVHTITEKQKNGAFL